MIACTVVNRFLTAGYRSQQPARCPKLTFGHRRYRCKWAQRHWVWKHCIFSDKSRFSLYHSDGKARVRWKQSEGLISACIKPTHGNRGPWMVCCEIHHGHPGWDEELASLDPDYERSQATGEKGLCTELVQDNSPPHVACDTVAILGNKTSRSWIN